MKRSARLFSLFNILAARIGAVCVLVACSTPAPQPHAVAPAAHHPTKAAAHTARSPIEARLVGPDSPPSAGTVQLTLTIDRHIAGFGPMRIDVQLPPGVKLAAGRLSDVERSNDASPVRRSFSLVYAAIPTADVHVIVDWRGQGSGFHADLPWGFGRPAPVTPEPKRLRSAPKLPGGPPIARPIVTGTSADR